MRGLLRIFAAVLLTSTMAFAQGSLLLGCGGGENSLFLFGILSLAVYKALGRRVAELTSGIYLCRLTAGDAVLSIRLLLLR